MRGPPQDEPKEIAAAPGQPRPLGAGRAQSQEVMERKDKNDAMRAQLRALKHLQARQKKHLKQLEKVRAAARRIGALLQRRAADDGARRRPASARRAIQTHEQQKADQRKQADKETEAETKQQTSEADKLAARQRTAQTDHAKQQAKVRHLPAQAHRAPGPEACSPSARWHRARANRRRQEMKEFLKKQAADSKARTKAHEAKLKQALKDMEKVRP